LEVRQAGVRNGGATELQDFNVLVTHQELRQFVVRDPAAVAVDRNGRLILILLSAGCLAWQDEVGGRPERSSSRQCVVHEEHG
jgi:hypothetical protein